MSCKIVLFVLSFFLISESFAGNQKDTLLQNTDSLNVKSLNLGFFNHSESIAKKKNIKDSVTFYFLKPSKIRPNLYFEYLSNTFIVKDKLLLHPAKSVSIQKINYGSGIPIYKMPLWILLSTVILIFSFLIVKLFFKKQVSLIFMAFYDTKVLPQISKEDQSIESWPFIFLYLIFSFAVGLFICLIINKTNNLINTLTFNDFLTTSVIVFLIFNFKVFTLQFLGYFFRLQKIAQEYTKVIYLSYFNFLFLLLPILFLFSLIDIVGHQIIFWFLASLLALIISIQFLRITINILLHFRLSKFYLILYLCALEICPIIILARIINNSF